jgi:phosphoadenosine phosphosulfate reductase
VATLPFSPDDTATLAQRFESRPAEDLLAWAAERFAGGIVLTCSWQRQSSVLVDMLWRIGAEVRIAEIDTGLLFPETHAVRERLVERYGIEVETIHPEQTVEEQAATEGPALWTRDSDRCCALRKISPMERAMAGMDAWITGIRRGQSVSRRNARKVEVDASRGLVKIQPLADWSDEDVIGYLYRHDVPYHALHDEGYPSIGCFPCTRPVAPGEDPRSGRWAGTGKTECGLHLPVGEVAAS